MMQVHTAQIILIEADSKEDALDTVASKLSESEPRWSDWHNAFSGSPSFAGRWGNFFGTGVDVLRYSDNAALAEEKIAEWLKFRMDEINRLWAKAELVTKDDYDPYAKWDPTHLNRYNLERVAELINDTWNPDTAVYDLHEWTASLGYFRERVTNNPDKQWLIPVDFHH